MEKKESQRKVKIGFLLSFLFFIFLALVFIPNFIRGNKEKDATVCRVNLRQIQTAKERWVLSSGAAFTEEIYMTDLVPDFLRIIPVCPSGGKYTVGSMIDVPTCSIGTNKTRNAFNNHQLLEADYRL